MTQFPSDESTPGSGPLTGGLAGSLGEDWPSKAVDSIDSVVSLLQQRVVRPIVLAARFMVFGLIAALMGCAIAIYGTIAAIRFFTDVVFAHHVWISDITVGAILLAFGSLALRKATRKAQSPAG